MDHPTQRGSASLLYQTNPQHQNARELNLQGPRLFPACPTRTDSYASFGVLRLRQASRGLRLKRIEKGRLTSLGKPKSIHLYESKRRTAILMWSSLQIARIHVGYFVQ